MNTIEMIQILHITFDGGPCGLKSTVLRYIEEQALKLGYKIIFVEESARKYFATYKDAKTYDIWVRQTGIFELQLNLEKEAREQATLLQAQGEKVIVCYDRSLRTNLAYMGQPLYDKLVEHFKMTHEEIDARYTDRLHLMSVAVDKPHLYVQDSERDETAEQAHALDIKLKEIWSNSTTHNNDGTMEDKLNRVWADIQLRIQKTNQLF